MESPIEAICYGGAALVAIVLASLARGTLPRGMSDRCAVPVAVGIAFCAGYVLLDQLVPAITTELIPKRHWHWLPYLAAGAMVLGPVTVAREVTLPERWLVQLLVAIVAAWLLVPTWASLDPPRSTWVPVLAAYLFAMIALLDPLSRRVSTPTFLAMLSLAAVSVAALSASYLSMVYAQVAAVAASAVIGGFIATSFRRTSAASGGIAAVFVILVAGSAFACAIEPEPARIGLLLAPAAPLALWLTVRGPLSRLEGWKSLATRTALVVMVLAIATVAVALGSSSGGGSDFH